MAGGAGGKLEGSCQEAGVAGALTPLPLSARNATRLRVRMLPYLASRASPDFSMARSNFKIRKNKLTAARVVVNRELVGGWVGVQMGAVWESRDPRPGFRQHLQAVLITSGRACTRPFALQFMPGARQRPVRALGTACAPSRTVWWRRAKHPTPASGAS